MTKLYRFANTVFRLELPEELLIPRNLSLFELSPEQCAEPDQTFTILVIDEPDTFDAIRSRWNDASLFDRGTLCVYTRRTGGQEPLECRFISFEGDRFPYAVTEEISESESRVFVLRQQLGMLQFDTVFASLLSFERHFLKKDTMILHCAYMCRSDEAVLFSAPSGTGKSTQADLWEKYRGTRTINGDDALLCKRDGRWYANGWSVCGSSEICFNESYPIRAIDMLSQAKENTIRRLNSFEAFRKLYPQLKINSWNSDFQNKAFALMDDLTSSVEIFEQGCDISEDAVRCLEQALDKA